jgi:sugar (pentulose or hexulose) kinase
LPARFERARVEAAKRLEPKAVSLKLPPATLRREEDIDLWWESARAAILQRLKHGPVIIG